MLLVNINGKNETFISLYEIFYDKIFNYIYRSTLNKEISEDLTGNTFMNALKCIQNKNPLITNFSGWIYKIATNELLMHYRKNKDKKTLSFDYDNSLFYNILEDDKQINSDAFIDYCLLKNAINKLNEVDSSIIKMHFYENMSYAEIGEILCINESTLRSRLHRALKKIRKLIEV